jgi:hypothetical protein
MVRDGTFWKRTFYKQLTPGRDSLSDTFYSELVIIKEALDLQYQFNILFRVQPLSGMALPWFQELEFCFPEAEYRCPDTCYLSNFTDFVVQLVGKVDAHQNNTLSSFRLCINSAFKHLARLERKDTPCGNGNGFARLGIAAPAVGLLFDDKVAESGNLYLLASLKGILDETEDRLYHLGRLFFGKTNLLMDTFNDVGFGHNNLNLRQFLNNQRVLYIPQGNRFRNRFLSY